MAHVAAPNEINLPWLVRLRWGAVAGQLITIGVVKLGLGLPLPVGSLLALVGVEAASNAAWAFRRSPAGARDWWLGATMVLDVLVFSGLLFFTGGPVNPFSFLYLVPIALAAVILNSAWTWALVLLSLACSAVLFAWHRPLELGDSHAEHMTLHLRGMWVAFGVGAAFIVYFLRRIRRALAEREDELAGSRNLAARQEKLAALATMAAGAAHELATPLATIALVAKELERHAVQAAAGPVIEDVRLVRSQVDRCRDILTRMSVDAGEAMGESFVASAVGTLLSRSLEGLSGAAQIQTSIDPHLSEIKLRVPQRALTEAIRGVLKNAQDASPSGAPPRVTVRRVDNVVQFVVADRGPGIAPEILRRIGEPFFTTKPPGQGMGLGVFLARTVVERLGGELQLRSEAGAGTVATIAVPIGREPT